MKRMVIYDPAMCCSTGVCGPSVDTELLRVSTVLNNLRTKGILVERYNLSNNPQVFVDNKVINELINTEGIEALPATLLEGKLVKTKGYPTNEEFCEMLGLSDDFLDYNEKDSCCGEDSEDCCGGDSDSCGCDEESDGCGCDNGGCC